MKIFVDTGDVEEVKKAADFGILDGVTTNPSLIAKTGKGFKETVLKICELVPGGAISAEVVATNYDDMLKEALEVSSWHKQIVVKVPMIPPGVKLIKELTNRGIRTNCTLVFSAASGQSGGELHQQLRWPRGRHLRKRNGGGGGNGGDG